MPYDPTYYTSGYWPTGWGGGTTVITPPTNDRRDLLEWGLTALTTSLKAVASQSVTYARGTDSVDLHATFGRKLLKLDDGEGGIRLQWTDMDFVIPAADLVLSGAVIEPERGDAIYIVARDKVRQYEVMPYPPDPCWTWSDPYQLMYRIHTKHVADEPYDG